MGAVLLSLLIGATFESAHGARAEDELPPRFELRVGGEDTLVLRCVLVNGHLLRREEWKLVDEVDGQVEFRVQDASGHTRSETVKVGSEIVWRCISPDAWARRCLVQAGRVSTERCGEDVFALQ